MNIPVSGVILLPITIGIFCFSSYLTEWAVFTSVLQGAALVNTSGGFPIGLSPYFFSTALIAAIVIPQWLSGRIKFHSEEPVRAHVRVLALFVSWCTVSAFLLPFLFKGVPVDSARGGVDRSYYSQAPLYWTFSNAGQAGYMVLNFIMVIRLLQMSVIPGRARRLAESFSTAGMFAAGVGVYQMLCNSFGGPFPSWLFNSNTAWAELPNQSIGTGFARLTATFVEPSEAAAFFAAWAVFELSLAIRGGRHNLRHWLCAAVGTLVLAGTTSTTGYITAAFMWIVIFWECAKAALFEGIIRPKAALATIGLAAAATFALVVLPSGTQLLQAVIFEKGQSASALHRTATFGRSVDVFFDSWGLGVGLGSNRAMSVVFYVLCNLGMPGALLVGLLLSQIYRLVRKQLHSEIQDRETATLILALVAAFIANGLSLIVSGAEITQPYIWILWGLLISCTRYSWLYGNQLS